MVLFFWMWGGVLIRSSPAYLAFILVCFGSTIFWFMVTTFTDPGIIPRGKKPEAGSAAKFPHSTRSVKQPDGSFLMETYCETCHIWRPPRASHCRDCDNCVLEFDHHCPFTRNCIGARNYASFVCFLLSVCLSLAVLFFSATWVLPAVAEESRGVSGGGVQLSGLLNGILIIFAVLLSLFLWAFTGYHVVLICSGLTTKEHLKGRRRAAERSLCGRVLTFSCLGITPSQLPDARALVPHPWDSGQPPIIDQSQFR